MQNLDYYTYTDENDVEGKCYSVLEFEENFEQDLYPNQLWLLISSLEVDEEIETKIIDEVVANQKAVFVAKRELDGWSEYYFYAQHSKGFKNSVSEIIGSKYQFELGINIDKKWTLYFQELMPDIFKFHQIEAKKIIRSLVEAGDDILLDREVEHYAKFSTETQRERAITLMQDREFNFLEVSEESSDEFSYIVSVSKKHNLEEEHIFEVMNDILDIALAEHGEYIGFSTVMASE